MRASPEPICGPNQWLVFEHFPKVAGFPKGKRFEADEYPILACNFQSMPSLWVSDPEIVQDIFVSKNAIAEKQADGLLLVKDIIGNSFIMSRSDEVWKAKRKACAHAFYKDRL